MLCAGLQFNPQYKCTGACAQQVYDKMFKTAAGALAATLAWPCLQGTCAGLFCLDCSGRVLSMSFQGPLLLLNQSKQLRLYSPVMLCLTSSHGSTLFFSGGHAWPALESCAGAERRSAGVQAAPSPRAWAPCRATGSLSRWWTPWAASPSSTWVRGHGSVSDPQGLLF